jgi:Protein of unknown function (DUF1186)/SEC-C motif
MDAAQILAEFARLERLPVEAIRAADADQVSAVPLFLDTIERYLAESGDGATQNALFFMFHMLGQWREKAAYRPLARLLRRPPQELDDILGYAITEFAHRVMAAVFDGDPQPLYDVILDPEADEFVRSGMCEAIAMVTARGEMPREEAARFLRDCYFTLDPQGECWVWQGWQSAIALLGFAELKPLVEQAFARGFISPQWLFFRDFEKDLQQGIDDTDGLLHRSHGDFSLFGDTIEEFSSRDWFSAEEKDEASKGVAWLQTPPLWGVPATNPWRDVGRNDPCPCGSGRKFKKCCLAAQAPLSALLAG